MKYHSGLIYCLYLLLVTNTNIIAMGGATSCMKTGIDSDPENCTYCDCYIETGSKFTPYYPHEAGGYCIFAPRSEIDYACESCANEKCTSCGVMQPRYGFIHCGNCSKIHCHNNTDMVYEGNPTLNHLILCDARFCNKEEHLSPMTTSKICMINDDEYINYTSEENESNDHCASGEVNTDVSNEDDNTNQNDDVKKIIDETGNYCLSEGSNTNDLNSLNNECNEQTQKDDEVKELIDKISLSNDNTEYNIMI